VCKWVGPRVEFSCTLCGECCLLYWVPVTAHDAARIFKYTGLRPRDFLALFPKEQAGEWSTSEILLKDGYYYLVLRKGLNGRCVFLRQLNGRRICSVYKVRPLTCRFYPFTYWREDNVVVLGLHADAEGFCEGIGRGIPHEFSVEYEAVVKSSRERAFFESMIRRWNGLVRLRLVEGTLNDFFEFLEGEVEGLSNEV